MSAENDQELERWRRTVARRRDFLARRIELERLWDNRRLPVSTFFVDGLGCFCFIFAWLNILGGLYYFVAGFLPWPRPGAELLSIFPDWLILLQSLVLGFFWGALHNILGMLTSLYKRLMVFAQTPLESSLEDDI